MGTPAGVGIGLDPPTFLKPGDEVSVTISGIGTLTNTCVPVWALARRPHPRPERLPGRGAGSGPHGGTGPPRLTAPPPAGVP